MSKFELSLSKNYVSAWGVQDGLREFIQNAIDQETVCADNQMFIKYDAEQETLYVGNKSSVLTTNSLLLGASTKTNDESTIGCFGEGYKVALLVLTRLDRPVTIYNYGAKEIWTSRFVKSRRYQDEILTIFVDKKYNPLQVPDNNLTIKIENITAYDYEDLVERTLFLQDPTDDLISERGRVLLDPKYKGKLFVNGLYISTQDMLEYGYDIKPKYLQIGRDRNLVNSFDIQWQTSAIWRENGTPLVVDLIKNNCPDVTYIKSWSHSNQEYSQLSTIAKDVYSSYLDEYDTDEIMFVDSQSEYDRIKTTYRTAKPVIVDRTVKNIIELDPEYMAKCDTFEKEDLTLEQRWEAWRVENGWQLNTDAATELYNLVEELLER